MPEGGTKNGMIGGTKDGSIGGAKSGAKKGLTVAMRNSEMVWGGGRVGEKGKGGLFNCCNHLQ